MTMTTKKDYLSDKDRQAFRNEDPITGEVGAHPIGTGVGAAVGGAESLQAVPAVRASGRSA